MHGAITEQDGVDAALHLQSSRQQTAADRLAIYQQAYLVRLLECLRELFPVLVQALGREEFDQFAAGYLRKHPPASYTLTRLADRFVDFLRDTRPTDVSSPSWPDFLIDLAFLEQTIDQVFEGPGVEELPSLEFLAARPDDLHALRFEPAPCLRLLALRFPVNDYYTQVKRGESPQWPQAAASWLAITRLDYVVRRIPLEQSEYHILAALVAGQNLGAALMTSDCNDPSLVRTWFAAWGRLRLLIGVSSRTLPTEKKL
jgi:hypothetical protein